MAKTVPAIYEGGLLRPLEPLDLEEHQRVTVTIAATPAGDEVIDSEYHRHLEEADLPEVSLDEVRRRLAKIPGSLTEDFTAEREERFFNFGASFLDSSAVAKLCHIEPGTQQVTALLVEAKLLGRPVYISQLALLDPIGLRQEGSLRCHHRR